MKVHVSVINEELAKNRSGARLPAVKEMVIDSDDEETITFDGMWTKHGFTSNHAIGFVLLHPLEKFLTTH